MYYAGLDAHAQYLRVAVLDKSGEVVSEGHVSTRERAAIRNFLQPFRPLRVVVETCPFWPWLRDQIEEPDVEFILAHARELRAIAQHAQKNDAVDAHLLARMLYAGLIPPAYAHASAALEQLRLVRHYAWLTRYRTMCANRIHGQLHQSGIQLPREILLQRRGKEEIRRFAPRLSPEQRRLIRSHLAIISGLDAHLRALRGVIRRTAQESAPARLLQTVPGIGPYWGLLLSSQLMPIERFRTANHLVSYAGLAPITRSSGGQTRNGPLPKAANRWVRGAFVAAVMSHVRHEPESSISRYYTRTKERIGWKKARVTAARRLARIVFSMLHSQQPWRDNAAGRSSERSLQVVTANISD